MHHHREIDRALHRRHAKAAYLLGQARLGLRDAVLYLLLCEVRIGAELEGDGQCHAAVGGGLARHVQHALDAVDLLLERRRHRLGDDLRVRAGIVGGDDDRRRHYLRVLRDRQEAQRDDPAEEGEHRQHARKDRAVDEEARQVHDALATWGATSVPGRTRCRPLTMMRSPGLSPERTMRWPFAVPPSVTSRYAALLSSPTTITKRLFWSVPTARSLTSTAGSSFARPMRSLTNCPGIRLPSTLSN